MMMPERVDSRRVRILKEGRWGKGSVLYWMSRDQRIRDNWALLYAQELALQRRTPLSVGFCLVPSFMGATRRQYAFMLDGIAEWAPKLRKKGIAFHLLMGSPGVEVGKWVSQEESACVVTDFDPLRIKRQWKRELLDRVTCPIFEVDAHNIVPCWVTSNKQEYAARTIRPKIHALLPEFLVPFPRSKKHPHLGSEALSEPDWKRLQERLRIDETVSPVSWIRPGEMAASKVLTQFCDEKLWEYDDTRNDPSLDGQSNLSPYLHFGQLSCQRVALRVMEAKMPQGAKNAFLEELVIRRELSDNYCHFNEHYDSVEGFPEWARKTLSRHEKDKREVRYTLERLERGQTHDPLWNAAQRQMVQTGKMHGYLRMYWAKKILEWTSHAKEALAITLALNDKYELDGRDPNGYVGAAWAIGGVHDRPWGESPVFGTIRSMTFAGCRRKFDIEAYMQKWEEPG